MGVENGQSTGMGPVDRDRRLPELWVYYRIFDGLGRAMKISRKIREQLTDVFESAFDTQPRFDKVASHLIRDAAEIAAREAIEYLKREA